MAKLLEGHYKGVGTWYKTLKNDNGTVAVKDGMGVTYPLQIEYGDFGPADPETQERAGGGYENFNIKILVTMGEDESKFQFTDHGILLADGVFSSGSIVKITEEELFEIENDFDPIEAPPGPYTIQPETPGKIVWLSGAPGMGKSTSAQFLARLHGYVYYEADCFASLKNPYVNLTTGNPSMAQLTQRSLNGPGMEERRDVAKSCQNIWADLMAGKDYDKELFFKYYQMMAMDISKEKKRIGGNWAVAHVLLSREIRDKMREWLGEDLVIVIMTMSSKDRRERILQRHSGSTQAADMMDAFEKIMEPLGEDEPNTIEVEVGASMTREEVVDLISKEIEILEQKK